MQAPAVGFVLGRGLTLGGTVVWAVEMCRRLAEAGRRAFVIELAGPDTGNRVSAQLADGVGHVRCDAEGSLDSCGDEISKWLPTCLLPQDAPSAFALCARLAVRDADQVRIFGVGHGDTQETFDLLDYFEPMITTFVAVNETMKERMCASWPRRRGDVICRPCPVTLTAVPERDYAAGDQPLRLVYAGRVAHGDKGAGFLIPLARRLNELDVPFRMRILGDGPYRDCLSRDVEEAPEAVRAVVSVEPPVPHDQMRDIWRSADVVLLVSQFESTGLSMLEGMAEGCVPVVTRCNGPKDIIHHGENGFITDIGDVEAMAESVQKLAQDRDLLPAMGHQAFETVRECYTYDAYMPWFVELTERAWAEAARSWPSGRSPSPPPPRRPWLRGRGYKARVVKALRSLVPGGQSGGRRAVQ
ncbi:MAG: glycosyltransferase family 4 protein [Phycisphaerae bacterium]|nr:glycosyltransferase family 4 protein [Phycisphaerae bacterium]